MSQKPRFTFTWQFRYFSMFPLDHSELACSPAFEVKLLGHSEWQLMFYPKGIENHRNSLSCYLYCRRAGFKTNFIQIDFALTVDSHDSKRLVTKEVKNRVFQESDKSGFNDLMSREELFRNKEAYLPNDTLTIKCAMWSSDVSQADTSSALFLDQALATNTESNSHFTGMWNDCSATIRVEVQRKKISWAIQNFSSIGFDERLTISVKSAIKQAPSLQITLYKSIAKQSVEIEIQRDGKSVLEQFFFNCKACVFHAPKGVKYATEDVHLFLAEVRNIWKLPSFIQLKKLKEDKYLNNTFDVLHLRFEFSYSRVDDVYYFERMSSREYGPSVTFSEPIEEFRNLYEKGEVYDLVIRAGDGYFKALKSIVGARSTVFRASFDAKEKEIGALSKIGAKLLAERITDFVFSRTPEELEDFFRERSLLSKFKANSTVMYVKEVEADTLDRMLVFMYSDALEDLKSKDAIKLYSAAAKYKVLPLKFRCSWILASCISVSNVGEILVLANQHDDDLLVDCAESFVRANSMEVLKSKEWSNLIKHNGTVAANVMLRMLIC